MVSPMRWMWIGFLVACGSSSHSPDAMTPDDGAVDAAIDAPGCDDAANVTVFGPVLPPDTTSQLALTLVSHDASGATCTTVGGGSGSGAQMTIAVPPGGMVTMVIDPSDDDRRLYTWTEVQPGDELRFPVLFAADVTTKTVSVELTIPAVTNVSSYDVYIQCEGGGDNGLGPSAPAGAYTEDVECNAAAQHVAVMVRADDGTNEQFAVSPITEIAASGPTTVTLGAFAPAALPTATIHGTAGLDSASIGLVPGASSEYGSVSFLSFAEITGDPVMVGPRGVPPTWLTRFSVTLRSSQEPMHTLAIEHEQNTPASIDLTTATDFAPLITAQLDAPLPRPTVTWSTARSFTADLVTVNAGHWLVAARPEPGSVRFPEVPADLLPDGPAELVAVNLIDAMSVASFDEARRDPGKAFSDREFVVSSLGDALGGIVPRTLDRGESSTRGYRGAARLFTVGGDAADSRRRREAPVPGTAAHRHDQSAR